MNALVHAWKNHNEDNILCVDFSPLLNYPSKLLIGNWQQGIRWCLHVNDSEESGDSYQEAPLPLSFLLANPDYQIWWQSIPAPILQRLGPYTNSEFTILYLCSQYPAVYDLFVSAPTLVWLLVQQARRREWPERQVEALCRQKRTQILQACRFPAKRFAVNLLSRLKLKQFGDVELTAIRALLWRHNCQKLNHLPQIDERLLQLLFRYPELTDSHLAMTYLPEAWSLQAWGLIEDCQRMAAQLGVRNMLERIGRCKHQDQLRQLHDSLVTRINNNKTTRLPDVDYGPPPFAGTEHIIPITTSTELSAEGRQQRHCVAAYHANIFRGRYYVYRITYPQRATLGLTLSPGFKPQLDQLKGFANQAVSEQTSQAVLSWLAQEIENYVLPGRTI